MITIKKGILLTPEFLSIATAVLFIAFAGIKATAVIAIIFYGLYYNLTMKREAKK